VSQEIDESPAESADDQRADELHAAAEAAGRALAALVIAMLTLVFRALQALFTLARPALLVGCVVALGYGAATLYPVLFAVYGGDIPAALVAALAVIVVPAALLVLAAGYDVFAVALASGGVMVLAREAAIRSPPVILAMAIPVSIGACFLHFTRKEGVQ
jgi:hypothetical protein